MVVAVRDGVVKGIYVRLLDSDYVVFIRSDAIKEGVLGQEGCIQVLLPNPQYSGSIMVVTRHLVKSNPHVREQVVHLVVEVRRWLWRRVESTVVMGLVGWRWHLC